MNEEVSESVHDWSAGAPDAVDELVPRLYDDLRRMARNRLRGERAGHTSRPTALVNDAYLELQRQQILRAEEKIAPEGERF